MAREAAAEGGGARRRDSPVHLHLAGHIGALRGDRAERTIGDRRGQRRREVQPDDAGAFGEEPLGDAPADAAAATFSTVFVDGGNFGGNDNVTGGSGDDIINTGGGSDFQSGGSGSDTFVIASTLNLGAGDTINGLSEIGTLDTIRLDAAGFYNFGGATITNIDRIALNQNGFGLGVTISNALASTADANQDGLSGDLRVVATTAMTNGVTVNASGLTGVNAIAACSTAGQPPTS